MVESDYLQTQMERISLFSNEDGEANSNKSSDSSCSDDASPQTVKNKRTIKVVKDKFMTNAQIFKEDLHMVFSYLALTNYFVVISFYAFWTCVLFIGDFRAEKEQPREVWRKFYYIGTCDIIKTKEQWNASNDKLMSTIDPREDDKNSPPCLSPVLNKESKSNSSKAVPQLKAKKSMYFGRTKFSIFQKGTSSRHKSMKCISSLDQDPKMKNIENYRIEQSK